MVFVFFYYNFFFNDYDLVYKWFLFGEGWVVFGSRVWVLCFLYIIMVVVWFDWEVYGVWFDKG